MWRGVRIQSFHRDKKGVAAKKNYFILAYWSAFWLNFIYALLLSFNCGVTLLYSTTIWQKQKNVQQLMFGFYKLRLQGRFRTIWNTKDYLILDLENPKWINGFERTCIQKCCSYLTKTNSGVFFTYRTVIQILTMHRQ